MSIEELKVTLKMLDIEYSSYICIYGTGVLFIKLINLELKNFILNLLLQNGIQYHLNDYTPLCCDIYIEIKEE